MKQLFEKGHQLIAGIGNFSAQNDVSTAFTIMPNIQQIEDKKSYENTDPKNTEPERTLTTSLSEHNIKSLNFFPIFYKENWRDYWYPLDWHWNKDGHRLAGMEITEFIINEYIPELIPVQASGGKKPY